MKFQYSMQPNFSTLDSRHAPADVHVPCPVSRPVPAKTGFRTAAMTRVYHTTTGIL